ncbi:class I SAM-dependent methyltransferase [Fodinibius salsisoli]|uniref:Class I SAM-dependent methyltransferase n=1 Tax=Fodinibius salsisoli TaxID=2820877 RepID=A0ABT3PI47_9BACT|nr:class I SAM-dependent methyltransferase [Fodinibius salsisoli]MCW9705584.1 class I SAM-dependent methyltransferase [Fodinibius salsisoli]
MGKSSVDEIRQRFDNDVERFSNLATGQSATIDAPLVLDLITEAAAQVNPKATDVLDVGCGAGNYTLQLLGKLPEVNATLVDLSQPMLERAEERIAPATSGTIHTIQSDIRECNFEEASFDIIMAAAVLHHLRSDEEWEQVFRKLYKSLKPGGSLWISDLIQHSSPEVHQHMWERYGAYLVDLEDEAYRDKVFAYIDKEDSPKPLMFQLNLLQSVGFKTVEVLHKNSCFAAFGAIK